DRIDVKGKVNGIGVLTAHVTFAFRDDIELVTRTVLRALPRESLKEFATGLASAEGLTGDLSNITTSEPTVTASPLQIDFDLQVRKYMNWAAATSEMSTIPKLPFPFAIEEDRRGRHRIERQTTQRGRLDTE